MIIEDEDGYCVIVLSTQLVGGPFDGLRLGLDADTPDRIMLGNASYSLDKSHRGSGTVSWSSNDRYVYRKTWKGEP